MTTRIIAALAALLLWNCGKGAPGAGKSAEQQRAKQNNPMEITVSPELAVPVSPIEPAVFDALDCSVKVIV